MTKKTKKRVEHKKPFSPRVKFDGTCYPYEEFRLTHGLVMEEKNAS